MSAWPRALLVGLMLAFALNSIGHAAHKHDSAPTTSTVHSAVCGFCVSFDHLATSAAIKSQHAVVAADSFSIPLSDRLAPALRSHRVAQPRAPPIS